MVGPPKPLSGRFAFQGFLESQGEASRWLALEADTGRRVVAVVVPASGLSLVEAARGVRHRHLAGLLEVVRAVDPATLPVGVQLAPGAGIAVTEFAPGRTLRQVLGGKPISPGKAVAWTLRLTEAVQALHGKGAFHGSISPRSVIAEPEGRAIAPVLSQLVAPPIGPYCPPERLKGAAESKSDDVWALHAMLYTALTGRPPFAATTAEALSKQMLLGKPAPLQDFGVDDPVLMEILERGLTGERRLRVVELAELNRTLDAWERNPRAMPPKRAALPRPAPRALMDIASGMGPSASRHSDVVIDDAALSDDEGSERHSNAGPERPLPPASPTPPRSSAQSVLPQVSSAPVLPQVSSAPVLPQAPTTAVPSQLSAPPAFLQVSSPPPLPQVTRPPPLPDGSTLAARRPPPLPSQPAASASLADLGRDVHTVSAVIAPVLPAQPVGARRLSFNPFEKKRRVWPLVLLAALGGGAGVYVMTGARAPSEQIAAPAPAAPAAPATPSVAVKRKATAEDRDSCVRSHFPEDAFVGTPSFDFVCADGEFRDVARELFGKGSGAKTPARVGLGWYELPATAIIRRSCCSATTPVILPETTGWCEQLQNAVRRIADDSAKAGDVAPAVRSFDKAVTCLFANRISRPYVYDRPNPAQRREFQEFLSRAAISEARR